MLDIYTKDYCPYCKMAKNLFDDLGIEYSDHDITATPEKMDELEKKSGMRTVPQVFLGEKCLGGYDDVRALHDKGELLEIIKKG